MERSGGWWVLEIMSLDLWVWRFDFDRLSTYAELEELEADDSMLDTIILILKRAIKNETWASINWQLPSPLNALALLTINRHNVSVVCVFC